MPYVVALSGGVASGKTTIANFFGEWGVPIIDADIIARQVVEKGSFALNKMIQHFGQHILLPSGQLNRVMMRTIIFNNNDERLWLNQLIHPLVQQETEKQINSFDTPYVLWVVPLLIDNNSQHLANRILIIDIATEIQLSRLQRRDNIDENLAINMVSSQVSNQHRLRYADDIIVNNGELNSLRAQVNQLHQKYRQLSKEAY